MLTNPGNLMGPRKKTAIDPRNFDINYLPRIGPTANQPFTLASSLSDLTISGSTAAAAHTFANPLKYKTVTIGNNRSLLGPTTGDYWIFLYCDRLIFSNSISNINVGGSVGLGGNDGTDTSSGIGGGPGVDPTFGGVSGGGSGGGSLIDPTFSLFTNGGNGGSAGSGFNGQQGPDFPTYGQVGSPGSARTSNFRLLYPWPRGGDGGVGDGAGTGVGGLGGVGFGGGGAGGIGYQDVIAGPVSGGGGGSGASTICIICNYVTFVNGFTNLYAAGGTAGSAPGDQAFVAGDGGGGPILVMARNKTGVMTYNTSGGGSNGAVELYQINSANIAVPRGVGATWTYP